MRAKAVLNLAVGLFIVAAVGMVGWQSMSGRSSGSATELESSRDDVAVAAIQAASQAPVLAARRFRCRRL